MIHLVCYSQSSAKREFFKQIFPPALSTQIFEKESDLIAFLQTLKIPTQIILDKSTFSGDLQAFLLRHDFHHTICVEENPSFEESLTTLRYGAILIPFAQLSALQWWWNRTTIVSSKIKGDAMPPKGLFAVFSASEKGAGEKGWDQLFQEYCQHSGQEFLSFSAQNPHLSESNAIAKLKENWPLLSTLLVTDLDKVFPRDLRALLTSLHQQSEQHNIRIVLDVQASQVLFEVLLDWCTHDCQTGLYRLQFNRTKMINKNSFIGMSAISPQAMTLEYVRYTWLAGQNIS